MKYVLYLLILFVVGCSEKASYKNFIDAAPQKVSERLIENPIIVDSLNITEKFTIDRATNLNISGQYLVFEESGLDTLWVINKSGFDEFQNIGFREGRGPGEFVQLRDVTTNSNEIFISDVAQSKIVRVDLEGNLISEHKVISNPDRFEYIGNERVLTQSLFGSEHVYTIQELGGEIINGFEKFNSELHVMMYGGFIKAYKGHLYFGGYSEPILKKYAIDTGELIYSLNVINSYDSSYNYATNEDGEYITMGFSPAAMYAVSGLEVIDNYIYITSDHNGMAGNKFIDVYSINDGQYISSYSMVRYPLTSGIAVDENYIYTIEMNKSADEIWLMKYNR